MGLEKIHYTVGLYQGLSHLLYYIFTDPAYLKKFKGKTGSHMDLILKEVTSCNWLLKSRLSICWKLFRSILREVSLKALFLISFKH